MKGYVIGVHDEKADAEGFWAVSDTVPMGRDAEGVPCHPDKELKERDADDPSSSDDDDHNGDDLEENAKSTAGKAPKGSTVGKDDEETPDEVADGYYQRKDDEHRTMDAYRHRFFSVFVFRLNGCRFTIPERKAVAKCSTPANCYMGEWQSGLPHGKGVLVYEGRTILDGRWKEGRWSASSNGEVLLPMNNQSVGEIQDNLGRIFQNEWRAKRVGAEVYKLEARAVDGKSGTIESLDMAGLMERLEFAEDDLGVWGEDGNTVGFTQLALEHFQEGATARDVNGYELPFRTDGDGADNVSEWFPGAHFFPRHYALHFHDYPYYGDALVLEDPSGDDARQTTRARYCPSSLPP
jgi:hypothetical protein